MEPCKLSNTTYFEKILQQPKIKAGQETGAFPAPP